MNFNDYAAIGFAILPWWTWPAIAGTVVASVWVVVWLDGRRDRRERETAGPYPCFAHLGTAWDDPDSWCFRRDGHDGPHLGPWDAPGDDPDETADNV